MLATAPAPSDTQRSDRLSLAMWLTTLAALLVACGTDPASTPCEPSPCEGDPSRICVVVDATGLAECRCAPGTQEAAGECEPIADCTALDCAGRGSCSLDGGFARCLCDAGYAGPACMQCADGYHDDGAGGCSDDACVPNPCGADRRCEDVSGVAMCRCPFGQHEEGDACVPDTTCMEGTCANGDCSEDGGVVVCSCDVGYRGAYCDTCDEVGGYHDDGAGGCTDDVCLPSPCTELNRGVCEVGDDAMAACLCDPGFHEALSGDCAPDEVCDDTRCGPRGTCDDSGGAVVCACDLGWTGERCDACAAGFHEDGAGGCTTDLCLPNPCADANRGVCTVDAGATQCACDPGYHEEAGACVLDEVCAPSSCNGHGTCDDSTLEVVCDCQEGWAGTYCGGCDTAGGYHDDGAGGCTTDVCLPNPCLGPNRGVCTDAGGSAACGCDPGYHEEGAVCALDEACGPSSCNGRGSCADGSGVVLCTCDPGYDGPYCGACDVGAGYHPDGAGGCTTDPCTPNPCDAPNQGQCTAAGTVASCGCDAGYHPDGVGGCTDDVCVPDPCEPGQLCRDVAGAFDCYVPACNDDNPCTDDSFDGTECVFTDRADGASCSTTLCTTSQQCLAGVCQGGSATDCSDTNPCTADSCDATLGCENVNDDSLVPDDGYDCTLDSCSAGVPSNTRSDAVCDDGSWCTGVGSCAPGAAGSDERGCVAQSVPAPPGPDGVCGRWRCDDFTMSFALEVEAAGVVCSDGIACTTGDQCDGAGQCAGTPTTGCGLGESCSAAEVAPFDIRSAAITGAITLGGGALADSEAQTDVRLALRNQETGSVHTLEYLDFGSYDGDVYPLRSSTSPYYDHVFDSTVLPGVYDVMYLRFTSSDPLSITGNAPGDPYPYGYGVLTTDVVLGPGVNTLNVDIPAASITGAITLGGGALADSEAQTDVRIALRNQETGSVHTLEYLDFGSYDGDVYPLRSSTSPYYDHVFDSTVLPGVYDVMYLRFTSSDPLSITGNAPGDPYPYGYGVLGEVTLSPGANTLNVDIPAASITGAITLGGGALADSEAQTDVRIALRNQATGSVHTLEYLDFGSYDGDVYPLRSSTSPYYDHVFDSTVLPGVYDVMYLRFTSSDPLSITGNAPGDPYPYGYGVLGEVTLSPGANTLNVDIPAASITGAITLGGGALPDSKAQTDVRIALRNQATGSVHTLEYLDFGSYDGDVYPLRSSTSPYYDHVFDSTVLPGVYDVMYLRFTSSDPLSITGNAPGDPYPYGYGVLGEVTLSPGANTLNVDIPAASITGAITLGGGALADSEAQTDVRIALRNQATGSVHTLEYLDFGSYDGDVYPLRSSTSPYYDHVFDSTVLPGTYDVMYLRFTSSDPLSITGNAPGDPYPYGYGVLGEVTLSPGANTLNVDIPAAPVAGPITLFGGELLDSEAQTDVRLALRNRVTGSVHTIEYLDFGSYNGDVYPLRDSTSPYYDHVFDSTVLPGVYDVMYLRFTSSDPLSITGNAPGDPYAYGYASLAQCVNFP